MVLLAVSIPGFGQQANSLEILLGDARTAQTSGNFVQAAADYKRAIELEPGVPQLWANLGLMQHLNGNFTEAIASFDQAVRLDPSLYVPNLFLGIDNARSGHIESSISFLIKAERLNEKDPQAPLALGRVYLSSGNLPGAVQQLDHAVSLAPELGPAWLALGIAHLDLVERDARLLSEQNQQSAFALALYAQSLQQQARFGEAVSVYQSALNVNPQPPCLRAELGFALWRNHDGPGAGKQFDDERLRQPECSLAILGQGAIAIASNDYRRATSYLEDLWKRDHGFFQSRAGALLDSSTGDTRAFTSYLLSPESVGLEPELRKALIAAIGLSDLPSSQSFAQPSNPGPHTVDQSPEKAFQSGHFSECTGRLAPQMTHLTGATARLLVMCAELAGDDRTALRAVDALGRAAPYSAEERYWSIQGNEHLAFQALARFQQLAPDSVNGHVLLGDIYHQLDRNDDALSEYLQALKIYPNNFAALLGAATAYVSANNLPAGSDMAKAALSLRPEDPDINFVMGEIQFGRGEYGSSLPYLKKSLLAKTQMLPIVHTLMGKVYAEIGSSHEAIQELELGASSDEDGSIHYLLYRLYRAQGDKERAEAALDQMKFIKTKRRERGFKMIEDPELSSLEDQSEKSTVH
jgi:tetratricopeptide (TPR) repeat protein